MVDRLLSVPEVARILSLSKQQTYRLLELHELDHYRVSERRIGISESQLQDYLTRHLIKREK